MFRALALVPLLMPVADLPGEETLSLKDGPVLHRLVPRETRVRRAQVPPVPDSNINDRMDAGIQAYVTVEGFPGKRMAMSPEELIRFGLSDREHISLELATEIVKDKLERYGITPSLRPEGE